jgi:hypothetical protein
VMALMQTLSEDGRRELGSPGYTSKMNQSAKGVHVSLQEEEDGWKLVRDAGKR